MRFNSGRISVCGHCANDLNSYKEVADESYSAVLEMLKRGMVRRATADLSPDMPSWKQKKAQRTLQNLAGEADKAFPRWINKLLADSSNSTKHFKIIRAHRRGLLHLDRPHRWGYPNTWREVAARIKSLDEKCVACGAGNSELHAHHIVYVSNFGTHRQENLITLCRSCHEAEHGVSFDFGENIQNPDLPPKEKPSASPPPMRPIVDKIVAHCPGCMQKLRFPNLVGIEVTCPVCKFEFLPKQVEFRGVAPTAIAIPTPQSMPTMPGQQVKKPPIISPEAHARGFPRSNVYSESIKVQPFAVNNPLSKVKSNWKRVLWVGGILSTLMYVGAITQGNDKAPLPSITKPISQSALTELPPLVKSSVPIHAPEEIRHTQKNKAVPRKQVECIKLEDARAMTAEQIMQSKKDICR